ncbi:MAG: hypothetical protein IKK68_02265 [Paludibacteraceae bacterium]|nr:hypothetical protein [Paludibacteraceae bacterium]
MKKKLIHVLALTMFGVGSFASTYMVIKQSDGSSVEYDVENVVDVTFRRDSVDNGSQNAKKLPCVTMCDNEMAVKTLNVVGINLSEPLKAKFWDGKGHNIIASTEDGSIIIWDPFRATIEIPDGVANNGTIVFENEAGETETSFIFRDTRNLLITHDDPEYLNLFNQERPYVEYYDEWEDSTIKMPDKFIELKESILKSENTRGDFSVFWDVDGYTAWTYSPNGESNPNGVKPKYPTPFGCFSESITNGETSFNDYVIKFEVYVPSEYPINGNGFGIGFYDGECWNIRSYCAFWQPSKASFRKDDDGVWKSPATFDNWTSGGDWMTITIPMEELRYNFATQSYYCSPQTDRRLINDPDMEYHGFGDVQNGLPFFDLPKNAKLASQLLSSEVESIQSIGIVFGQSDQPNQSSHPFIAVDNLRIVPKDNNGAVYPMLKWGQPTRDFYISPIIGSCK